MTKRPQPELPVLLLTREQVLEICQITGPKLDEWTHREGFPVIRENQTVRIPLRALMDWLDQQGYETNSRPADPVHLARLPTRARSTKSQLG